MDSMAVIYIFMNNEVLKERYHSYNDIGDCMDEYIRIKNKHKKINKKSEGNQNIYFIWVTKLLITVILTLSALILLKQNKTYQKWFHEHIFEKSFSFATLNQFYESKFGSSIPFQEMFLKKEQAVFEETLSYKEVSKYLDGAKLKVDKNYLVPIKESGMVVFVGNKEGYGNTVIIEGTDGVETWYGNMEKMNVKVYDYVEKGNFLGETKGDTLYMVFKKDGAILDYTKYLS